MRPASQRLYRARWPLAVLAGTFILIRLLSAPGVQPADAGEFQLVVRDLGIAHPPGYALYTLTAHVWGQVMTRMPLAALGGAPAVPADSSTPAAADAWTWAVNAFSAFLAVLVLALVYRSGFALSQARIGGLTAALALFATPTFLAQTAVANIRLPTALFTALLVFLTLRWLQAERDRPAGTGPASPDWRLAALALVAGLAAGHHASLAFLAAACAVLVLGTRPALLRDGRTMAAVAGALALAFLPLLYLPLRDLQGALFAEGRLRTPGGFLNHISAADFRGDALYFQDLTTALDRAAVVGNIFLLQFGAVTLALGAAGLVILLKGRDRSAGLLLLAVAGLTTLLTLTYRAPQTTEYLLPAYLALALAAGVALAALSRWRPRRLPLGRALLALWLAVTGAAALRTAGAVRAATPDLSWLPATFAARGEGDASHILASWHFYTPLRYVARHGLGTQSELSGPTDSKIHYVYPEGAETPGETWLRRMGATPGPVLITNRPQEVRQAGIPLWPVPGTPFHATSGPAHGQGQPSTPVQDPIPVFGDQIPVFDDRIQMPGAHATWAPDGGRVQALVTLRALRPLSETLAITAQLIDPATGLLWGQTDHAIRPERWADGRDLVDELIVVPFRGPRPARLRTDVGLYRHTAGGPERLPVNGRDALTIANEVDTMDRAGVLPAPRPGQVPFGNAMTLAASSLRRDGDQLIVDLTWLADREAARSDYTVSVQAHGDGWSAQDDGTPALGAFPTLKWLPGMVIHDRHRLRLPAGLAADAPFHVTVGVYDAFSLEPLPVTDAERVRQGQGQAVEVWRQGP